MRNPSQGTSIEYAALQPPEKSRAAAPGYAGSSECRSCHQEFYSRWAPSFHGLAMQPFRGQFAKEHVTPQKSPLRINQKEYRVDLGSDPVVMTEVGPTGKRAYPLLHAMGGKNVYYFLTELERGFLQVLPVAYDVRRKEWYDTTLSALRHFSDIPEQALDWKERPLTFNTGCYKCHVSQLSNNYDAKADSYHTTWKEPGINCETCHGPAEEHVRQFRAAPAGAKPAELHVISTRQFTHAQINDLCASCHSKMMLLTTSFAPGERLFDHFDLVTWENPDFYPDGRDLGENYTLPGYLSSACVRSGKLDCLHCHTSAGRRRFAEAESNRGCLPCHADKVNHAPEHTHHLATSLGNRCVSCHMPTTEFARMRRTDHSLRPPAPAATVAFGSPNACNLCHTNETAAWADRQVRQWYPRDYETQVLQRGELIRAGRRSDWRRLPEMIAAIENAGEDRVYRSSLIRLLRSCESDGVGEALLRCLKDQSPLIRGSAADALGEHLSAASIPELIAATRDEYRLVRIRAAASLASVPSELIPPDEVPSVQRASGELEASLKARPDDYLSHYNLGNYYLQRNQAEAAIGSFQAALRLQADYVPAMVNASLAYNLLHQNDQAEASLRQALKLSPTNAPALLNLGMLLGELGRLEEAESSFRAALKYEPRSAQGAFNLGVLLAAKTPAESLEWCRKAAAWQPSEPKYAYTVAFYLQQQGDVRTAIDHLQGFIQKPTADAQTFGLLGELLESQSRLTDAAKVYREASQRQTLSQADREQFAERARALLNK